MADEAVTQQVIGLRPAEEIMTRQRLPNFVGVSGRTAGAKGLSMHIVVIPPGAAAELEVHACAHEASRLSSRDSAGSSRSDASARDPHGVTTRGCARARCDLRRRTRR